MESDPLPRPIRARLDEERLTELLDVATEVRLRGLFSSEHERNRAAGQFVEDHLLLPIPNEGAIVSRSDRAPNDWHL
jgi:hypothetical protein